MKVLLVENIAPCTYLFRNTLHEDEFSELYSLQCMRSAGETLMFLRNMKKYRFAIKPDIIILDQELPDQTGYELIAAIREMPEINEIPLIMIGSEMNPQHPFGLTPDEYHQRPDSREDLILLLEQTEDMLIA